MRGATSAGLGRRRVRGIAPFLLLTAICGCSPPPAQLQGPTNLVLIVVDTLRADHLPFHGYSRDTAPNLRRLFAEEGVVFEAAYSQAAWTPPSMASMLTGRWPARLAPADVRQFIFPDSEPTVAERLLSAGYRTGGFQGNLLLGHSFARGFQRYEMTGHDWQSMSLPADAVVRPALDWLARRGGGPEPYFLYAHLVDPHDPYIGSRRRGLPATFDPDYTGPMTGDEIHGLNEGTHSLSSDPERDIYQLTALYDEDILAADRAIGEIVAAVEARSNGRPTLIVVTSDHGEEIQDHGGWAHGRTIYQEIVHVPLAFRLAGVIREGRRVAQPVPLLDVAPTLLAAAGVEPPRLDGASLLPVLLDPRRSPESRPIHLRSWQRGPLRLGLIEGHRKTMVYNRGEAFRPDPGLESHLAIEDDRRLLRAATFDLDRDPGERRPLAPDPDQVEAILAEALPTIGGVRVLLRDAAPGTWVAGRLLWSKRPRRVLPLLLDGADRVTRDGRSIEFRLRAERISKGFVVQGDVVALEQVQINEESTTVVELGRGSVSLPARRRDLARPDFPAWNGRRSLRIWYLRATEQDSATMAPLDEDTVRRLKALGYL